MKSLQELMSLDGRVALITGGAGHIGRALAQSLMELGVTAVINDCSEAACDDATEQLSATETGAVEAIVADLADEKQARDMVRDTLGRHGRLDILIHSAALVGTSRLTGWAEPFEKQSLQAWDAALGINLSAAFVITQEAAPALASSGHGSIIFISSIYGMVGPVMDLYRDTGMAHPGAYGASKAGLLQYMRYLSSVLAPEVRVNAISPGGVLRGQPEIFKERYCDRTPLGRMATEEDLKGAAAFLASDLSAYVTGHNLVVDGGWTAW